MLNATWLETFTTLAETGHFTRAAQRLNMTQPGVSQHLRKLEAQLGQKLIAQDGKSFSLTPAGEAVRALGQARRDEERRLREAIATDSPDAGELRIACSGSFAMLWYPRILTMLETAPDLAAHLEAAPQAAIKRGLLDGAFDLGILDHDPSHPRLEAEHLGEEELCLVLPVRDAGIPVTFATLEAHGFVAHPDGFAHADELLSQNFPDAYQGTDRLRVRTYINQIGQILDPVARGIGYTLLPRSGVEAYTQRDMLAVIPLPKPKRNGLWLTCRKGRPLSARLQRVKQLAKEIAAALG
ncbi:LysR family transcriptional regulator [Leisingera sp. ANG59]|uniref:LysR family transcriptional regulator n=1 Tax=Leisingera sp. ANG59 TaxID=2675221 RepID=UPI001571C77F|nr:LysR family transcriptional regulator [Leisingera sp. ANG59]NSY39113.1 LysR family transcriptional regulator [Leisingera sp. ANG59]